LCTRFKKKELHKILDAAELPEIVGSPQSIGAGNAVTKWDKFHREEIPLFMFFTNLQPDIQWFKQ
jgi:hypothetical protein